MDKRRESIDQSIFLISQEMTVLKQQYDFLAQQIANQGGNRNNQVGFDLNQTRLQAIDQQLAARQIRLLEYQAERNRTVTAMGNVYRQAVDVLAQRQATAAEFERQTGQLQKRDEQLEKWKARLDQQADALEQADPKGSSSRVKALERKLETIAAYLPFDWEGERQRLLAEWSNP